MEFGPHAPFSDPLNLAFAKDRLAKLKGYAALGIASPAQFDEMAQISARIAAYYQQHVDHFIARAAGPKPVSRFEQLVLETEGVQ